MPHVNIRFYQFEKRSNSTLQPGGGGTTYACQIFDPCSVLTPRIKLSFPSGAGNPTLWNYAYIGDFSRFYFVRDWVWENGLWVARLVEDVLATWRENIRTASEYVSRAAAAYDGTLVDTLYPTKAGVQVESVYTNSPYTDDVNEGGFVLSTINGSYVAFGAATYWYMSNAAFSNFREQLLSSADYLNISSDEISGDLTKALFNPYQYCVSCMWFPMITHPIPDPSTQLAVGWWSLPVDGYFGAIGSGMDMAYIYRTFRVPDHPQQAERGIFTRSAPYSRYTLYFPPFGEIELDGSKIGTATQIYVKILVDMYTGGGYLYVSTDDPGDNLRGMAQQIIAVRSAQVGVPVSLAQLSYQTVDSIGQLVQTGIQGLYGAAKGLADSVGKIGSAVGSALSGDFGEALDTLGSVGETVANNVGDAAQASLTEVQYKGTCGAVAVYSTAPYLQARFYLLADGDNERRGKPLCQVRQLGTLPGYIKCVDADLTIAGTREEAEAVKQHLVNGFFME